MTVVDSTSAAPLVRVRVARSDALAGAGPHAVAANGMDVVIVRSPQGLRAFQGRCPHQGALLGEGEIDGGALVCRNHRWRFDVNDGRRQNGPGCLACYTVTEQDGDVFVDVPQRTHAPDGAAAAKRTIDDLSGPRGWPVVGNLFQLDLARLHEVLEGWAKDYGPLYRYRLGSSLGNRHFRSRVDRAGAARAA